VPLDDHPHLQHVVHLARRRLRANRTLAVAGPALVTVGVLGLGWSLAARVVILPPLDVWVAAALVAGAVAALVLAASRRVPPLWAAWAADRWLGTRDAFATAVELLSRGAPTDPDGSLRARQIAMAEERAAAVQLLPGRPQAPTRLLGVGAALILVAGLLGVLPNPQDIARADRAADRRAVEESAAALRDAAEDLRQGVAEPERLALAEELEQLAGALPEADLPAALERLETARAELLGRMDADLGTQRTALAGLAQELGSQPLAGGSTVQEQLEQLAAQAEAGALEDEAALAERLAQLAEALAAGAPDVAEGLRAAGAALAAGTPSAAAAGLRGTAESVSGSVTALDGQAALGEAAGATDAAADGLRGRQAAGEGQGQGQGEGEGQADGPGQGAGQGEGQGAGQGQGQGGGQGQGQGGEGSGGDGSGGGGSGGGGSGGGGAGTIGSGGDGDGGDGAQGGAGRARGGEDQPGEGDADLATVFDPLTRSDADGEDLPLGGASGPGGTELEVGTARGAGARNGGLVPYREVLADYRDEAARTIEQPGYPPRLRSTVRDYFDQLGGRQ
jgi:hypothetical protein